MAGRAAALKVRAAAMPAVMAVTLSRTGQPVELAPRSAETVTVTVAMVESAAAGAQVVSVVAGGVAVGTQAATGRAIIPVMNSALGAAAAVARSTPARTQALVFPLR